MHFNEIIEGNQSGRALEGVKYSPLKQRTS